MDKYRFIFISFSFISILFCQNHASAVSEKLQLKFFNNIEEENLQPTKWDVGDTTISNEHRLDLFYKSINNIGEGFIGVGSTQNFSLAAMANSEWVWLIDFTRIVVAANKIHVAFLKESNNPSEFKKLWHIKSLKGAQTIIRKEYTEDPDLNFILKTLDVARPYVMWRIRCINHIVQKRGVKTWFTDKRLYDRIRNLALRGHIKILKGDLKGKKTLRGISNSAKQMGVKINVLYLSNAEEYFKKMDREFRYNIQQLPTSSKSMILRTTTIYYWKLLWAPDSDFQNTIGFHYNVMKINLFNKYLMNGEKDLYIWDILKKAKIYGETGFSEVIASPGERH